MKNHHIMALRTLALLVVFLAFAPVAVLCFDPYDSYDSYGGGYSSVDYSNSAWTGSGSYDTGGSSYNSGGTSGSSGSNSSGASTAYTTDYTDANLPSGYKRVNVTLGNYAVKYTDGTQESNAAAATSKDYAGRIWIYVRSASTGRADTSQKIGAYFTTTKRGYINTSKLPAPVSAVNYASSAPAGARLVNIDDDGNVTDATTGVSIEYAMREKSSGKIYNRNNSSEIGKLLSATTGYLNEFTVTEPTPTPPTATPTKIQTQTQTTNAGSQTQVKSTVQSNVSTNAVVGSQTPTTQPQPLDSINQSVPAGAKLVFVVNVNGAYSVFDKETGEPVPLAFYSSDTKEIYYGNSDELYGKMLTENMGYIEPDKFAAATPIYDVIATGTFSGGDGSPVSAEPESKNVIIRVTTQVAQTVSQAVVSVVNTVSGWFKVMFRWGR